MKKSLLVISVLLFLLGCIFLYQSITYNDKKLHIIVCDVGQGDAIFIRTPRGSDILIDGGPDNSVLACLGKYMPFWDRTLEIVALTHPHADHLNGLIAALDKYKISAFITEDLKNGTAGFSKLMNIIKNEKIKIKYVYAGDRFLLSDGLIIQIIGPDKDLYRQVNSLGENGESLSLEILIHYQSFSTLLTGDSQTEELKNAVSGVLKNIDLLQIPHHGSRFGLNSDILDILNPKIAVISVGKNNKYGHPTSFILDLLKSRNIKNIRTDKVGDIEIVSDGKSFFVKN
jgi:competence protein ComEC